MVEIIKVIDVIKKQVKELEQRCRNVEMEEKTIKSFLAGEEVRDCPYCKTYNRTFLSENKKQKFDMYECNKCNKTYLESWKLK